MRSRYVYDKTGDVIYAEEGGTVTLNNTEQTTDAGYYVMPDIQPYKSMVDGSIINSRSRHREHLRQHGCIEYGNDKSVLNPVRKPLESPPGLKETIIRVANEKLRSR